MPSRIYKFTGFDQSQQWPTTSWVIPHGNDSIPATRCSVCSQASEPRTALAVHGFDEFRTGPKNIRGFWPNDEELISLEKYTKELASILSGVRSIPVIYADWNQSTRARWLLARKKPRLGALEVDALVEGGFQTKKNQFLPTCGQCSSISLDHSFDVTLGLVRPIADSGGSTDVFSIRGASEVFFTAEGLKKLRDAGFSNILTEEAEWHYH